MDEIQLKELQNVELEILDEILRICKKHNIHVIMMGGTCLGAIRHDGIIPWDDDIDVGMIRNDYEKFKEICKNELNKKYFFQNFDSEENCGFIFGKIRKNNTILLEDYSTNIKMHQGIWVDIFPFDYVSDDYVEHQHMYNKLLFQRNLLAVKTGFEIKKDKSLLIKISYYLAKFICNFISKKSIIKKINKIMYTYNDNKTNTLFPYGCAWGLKERIAETEFFDTINHEFSGRTVQVVKDYDKYLKSLYGDYMTPVKEGGSGHNNVKVVFDINEEKERIKY